MPTLDREHSILPTISRQLCWDIHVLLLAQAHPSDPKLFLNGRMAWAEESQPIFDRTGRVDAI